MEAPSCALHAHILTRVFQNDLRIQVVAEGIKIVDASLPTLIVIVDGTIVRDTVSHTAKFSRAKLTTA